MTELYVCDSQFRNSHTPTDRPTAEPTKRTNQPIKRMTQALARLRFDDAVNVSDVEEAIRLTRMSKVG